MELRIKIENNKELQESVKKLVDGYVKTIVTEEINLQIKSIVQEKISQMLSENYRYISNYPKISDKINEIMTPCIKDIQDDIKLNYKKSINAKIDNFVDQKLKEIFNTQKINADKVAESVIRKLKEDAHEKVIDILKL